MREILFRGKRINNSEWVYGFLYETEKSSSYNAESYILEKERLTINYKCVEGITTHIPFVQVTPDTVGQFTGVTDKNGKKIFEGDICTINFLTISGKVNRRENYKCEFYEGKFCFVSDNGKFRCWYSEKEYIYEGACRNNIEVVGNIHDNPELLKGDNND